MRFFFFFFNDTATTEIYTLSLHDALPILFTGAAQLLFLCNVIWSRFRGPKATDNPWEATTLEWSTSSPPPFDNRSEEHTSELQSRLHLVCRLLLEKKKNTYYTSDSDTVH